MRAAIAGLQKETHLRTAGDDSGLRDIWDEICLQVQGEESVFWDAYVDTIEVFAAGVVAALSPHEQMLVWLLTPEGDEWSKNDSITDDDGSSVPVIAADSVQFIVSQVLNSAANWSNARIRRALERGSKNSERLQFGIVVDAGYFEADYSASTPTVNTFKTTRTLAAFIIRLLAHLQGLGTVSAIDYSEYSKVLDD